MDKGKNAFSLYPFVQFVREYPSGEPVVITRDFCNTLNDNKLPYKGVIKVGKL